MKKIFIVNGRPTAGKTLFGELSKEFVDVVSYSSITPIKKAAIICGWDKGKSEKDRKFLSDLKALTTAYSDLSFNAVLTEVVSFRMTNYSRDAVMLIDVREPYEIDRLKKTIGAETIFINNPWVPAIESNSSDANVEDYDYDHYIINDGCYIDDYKETIKQFYETVFTK